MDEATLSTRLKQIDDVTAISVSPGNADANEYMRGMANGLILAQAIMADKDPDYLKGPLHADFIEDLAPPRNFTQDLASAVNGNSRENGSNTPDFLLAEFLVGCLAAFDAAVHAREKWYGRDPNRGPGSADEATQLASSAISVTSSYAILDVKGGRQDLDEHFSAGGDPYRVTIVGTLSSAVSRDDGESIEFGVDVEKVDLSIMTITSTAQDHSDPGRLVPKHGSGP